MPELPEVKNQVDFLTTLTDHYYFIGFEFTGGKFIKEPYRSKALGDLFDENVIYSPNLIQKINNFFKFDQPFSTLFHNKGKFIYSTFCCNSFLFNFTMGCSLGMSGSWTLQEKKHNHFYFLLQNKKVPTSQLKLYFNDPRRFGNINFYKNFTPVKEKIRSLGIDLFSKYDEHMIIKLFRKYDKLNICEALMNQKIIAGVGNYIKCEALYDTNINPTHFVSQLDDHTLTNLINNIYLIMRISYDLGGASFHTYENNGKTGGYQEHFNVYGKKKTSLNEEVVTIKTPDQRTTYCTKFQLTF